MGQVRRVPVDHSPRSRILSHTPLGLQTPSAHGRNRTVSFSSELGPLNLVGMSEGSDRAGSGQPAAKMTPTQARKMPPPEKPEASRLRSTIILSFWAVIVLLGVPMWWQTTSIYRAKLPIQEMLSWSEGQVCEPSLPIQIWISTTSLPCPEAKVLVEQTQRAWHTLNNFPPYDIELRLDQCATSEGEGGVSNLLDPVFRKENHPDAELELMPVEGEGGGLRWQFLASKIRIGYTPGALSRDTENLASSIASFLRSISNEEQASAAKYLVSSSANARSAEGFLNSVSPDVISSITQRETRSFRYAARYHLTFSLFTPGPAPSSWAIEAALDEHIKPWITALETTSNFCITTQVQMFSSFSEAIKPISHDDRNGTYLRYDDVTAFVNAAEWPISPSIGSGPTMNFVLYVPAAKQAPLTIEGSGETSWLIPQWGGISILNPQLQAHPETGLLIVPAHLDQEILTKSFETFTSQMLSLLGVPSLSLNGKPLPLPVRLQSHKRLSAISVYHRASSTLGSLARLSQSLGSIPIPKKVAKLVDDTMEHLEASCQQLRQSNWDGALYHAREAYANSEKAFFEKSMVGQVYFQDEHKAAVYLPLLGPIGVPLIVCLVGEIKQLMKFLRASKK